MQWRALFPSRPAAWAWAAPWALWALATLARAQALPPTVGAALERAKVPRDAVALLLVDAQGQEPARLDHRSTVAMNPASVMKLVTTFAALELLGPAYTWSTPVYADAALRDGTLHGNLYIQGQGDPKLVIERLWLLLRRVQALGIQQIDGDIVLDRSAFELPSSDPARFDGEPLRPYNASPDALLINYKSVLITLTPDPAAKRAHIAYEPALYGVQMQPSVPLQGGDCADYRGALRADDSDASRMRFGGAYPASCGEKVWPVAYAEPARYAERALQALWLGLGGKLTGSVRAGTLPIALAAGRPLLRLESPALAEVVRDINKYSNNVMAQQLFLTLARNAPGEAVGGAPGAPPVPATFEGARAVLQGWWNERIGADEALVLDNGSGLSRSERVSARGLARLLQSAYVSPLMPELMASLPISGIDGTLRRSRSRASGYAHLKTGSLHDVLALAGFIHAPGGKRYVLVALVNHPNAQAARPALDALVEWAAQ
ncbi:MAG: D-alanyl-D-alanine carboxypeptidase/D-alanyl-D-alanine endopeptidase [Rhodoferax sp.]